MAWIGGSRRVMRVVRPTFRGRDARETLTRVWRSGGLLILGSIAAGMTAFPEQTLALLRPFSAAAGMGWRTGLGAVSAIRDAGGAGMRSLRSLTALSREARELEQQLEALEQRTVFKEEKQRELIRLRRLLMLQDELPGPTVPARVLGSDPDPALAGLVLDAGTSDGVREGQGVVGPAGAVGRVLSAGPATSTVLWLADPRSRVAAFVQRSRVRGVLAGEGSRCVLKYLAAGDDVRVGDRVLTAGGGSAFPKGILMGLIKEVRPVGMLLEAEVIPAVQVRRLEEVFVLSRPAGGS